MDANEVTVETMILDKLTQLEHTSGNTNGVVIATQTLVKVQGREIGE
jgi:hypothetical protein